MWLTSGIPVVWPRLVPNEENSTIMRWTNPGEGDGRYGTLPHIPTFDGGCKTRRTLTVFTQCGEAYTLRAASSTQHQASCSIEILDPGSALRQTPGQTTAIRQWVCLTPKLAGKIKSKV